MLAMVETIDNGKPIRETMAADLPLAVDHFRYFAGCIRAQEGSLSEIDDDTVAYHFHEPLGVVGQIIPWNFPILMAVWKLAPALAAGNCVVLKPAEQTPMSIMVLMELIGDLLPPACSMSSTASASKPASRSPRNKRIAKIAFTGETTTGRLIMQYASENIIPVHAGARRQVAQHLLRRRAWTRTTSSSTRRSRASPCSPSTRARSAPARSRALVQESIYERSWSARSQRVEEGQAGPSARSHDDDRRAGFQRSAREDPHLHRHRQAAKAPRC